MEKQMADVAASGMFYAAPFASDGELVGVGHWRLADLSPRWLEFCRQLLASQGKRFRAALPGPLNRLQLSFTSTEGTALLTFDVGGQIAASAVYLRGENPAAEQEVLAMFVESLRRTAVVQQGQAGRTPFQAVFGLNERPLHVVVAWGNPAVNDEDSGLVTELGNHMAAAFLCPVAEGRG
jgi:hypothetical protein